VPAALPCVEPALLGSESSPTTESIRIMGRCAQDSLECCTQQSRQLMDRNQRLCLFSPTMPILGGVQHHRGCRKHQTSTRQTSGSGLPETRKINCGGM
jgi:hypothetical protein